MKLVNNMEKDPFFKKIDIQKETDKSVNAFLGSGAFTGRKVTDTPMDDLQVVNRKFVTLHGTSANRPTSSVVGQFYYDTTLDKPIWWNGTSFVDATGGAV
jgi:hypothetical protein